MSPLHCIMTQASYLRGTGSFSAVVPLRSVWAACTPDIILRDIQQILRSCQRLIAFHGNAGSLRNWWATSTLAALMNCVVPQVDTGTGEVAGVFESIQPSDTDLGSKAPKDVKIVGLWYGQLTQ